MKNTSNFLKKLLILENFLVCYFLINQSIDNIYESIMTPDTKINEDIYNATKKTFFIVFLIMSFIHIFKFLINLFNYTNEFINNEIKTICIFVSFMLIGMSTGLTQEKDFNIVDVEFLMFVQTFFYMTMHIEKASNDNFIVLIALFSTAFGYLTSYYILNYFRDMDRMYYLLIGIIMSIYTGINFYLFFDIL